MKNNELTNKKSELDGWVDWANHHRIFFGWKSNEDGQMVTSWIGFFRGEGYTPEEMMVASKKIASILPPPFQREHHLNHLVNFLKQVRAENYKTIGHQNDDLVNHPIPCKICRNFGIVSVPHLSGVRNGEWTNNYTTGVYCSCYCGNKYSGVTNGKGEQMTSLHNYERMNSAWQRQIKDRAEREKKLNFLREDIRPKNNLDLILSKIQGRYQPM